MKSQFITGNERGYRVWDDDNSGVNKFVFQNHIGFPYPKPIYFELLSVFHQKCQKMAKKSDKIEKWVRKKCYYINTEFNF